MTKNTSEEARNFSRNILEDKRLRDFLENEEDDDEDEEREPLFLRPWQVIVLLLVVVGVFAGYAVYKDKIAITADEKEIKIIRADTSSIKEKPEDPGGMVISNRDKAIYEHLSNTAGIGENLPRVEKLLPAPEQPIDRDMLVKEDTIVKQVLDDISKHAPEVEEKPDEVTAIAALEPGVPSQNIPPPSDAKETVVAMKKPDVDVKKEAPKLQPTLQTAPMPSLKRIASIDKFIEEKVPSGYFIQLGAYREMSEIEENWQRVKNLLPEKLASLSYYKEKADLKEKGVFFRLQAGPIEDKENARNICQALQAKNQGCFVVKH